MVKASDGERNTERGSPAILSAGAAHDLANLVAVIGGTAAILADESRDDPSPLARAVREHAIRIGSCVEKASELIERLPGRTLKPSAPRSETFDLRAAINEALDLTQPLVPRSILEANALGSTPLRVNGATLDAIQLVLNLVLNARDAVVKSADPQIGLSCDLAVPSPRPNPLVGAFVAGRSYARVTVSDTGTGLDLAMLKRRLGQDEPIEHDHAAIPIVKRDAPNLDVSDSDVSSSDVPSPNVPGLDILGFDVPGLGPPDGRGWGLRIVADIVRRARGALRVRSTPQGTTLEVFWPIAIPSGTPDMTDRVILFIAGHPARTAAFADAFEAAGGEVALCLDAEDALRSVSEDRGEWDLVLLAGNGRHHEVWGVAERMRDADPTLPVLLCSDETSVGERDPDGFTAAMPLAARPADILRAAERIMPANENGPDPCAF